jgi:hypothetical protein
MEGITSLARLTAIAELLWEIPVVNNILLCAHHVPGKLNDLADQAILPSLITKSMDLGFRSLQHLKPTLATLHHRPLY